MFHSFGKLILSQGFLLVGFVIGLLNPHLLRADDKPDPSRGIYIEEIKNEAPTAQVRVSVDRPNRIYKSGEEIKVTIQTNLDGYLYLFYHDASNEDWILFPNKVKKENTISAGKAISVPAPESKFRFRVGKPFGRELLKAVVTTKPIALKAFESAALTDKDATRINIEDLRGFAKYVKATGTDWAEHDVEITTVAAGDNVAPPVAAKERRFGLFVGIDKYDMKGVGQLPTCVKDARLSAQVFKEKCGLDEVTVLLNREANLKTLEEAINKLVIATKPGDCVVIFWSGHGGYVYNDKQKREHLLLLTETNCNDVTANSSMEERLHALKQYMTSSIDSNRMQRWLQRLDGRRIILIIDSCFSAGLHSQGKSLTELKADDEVFFGDLLRRSKDIDQREIALLASSKANETSLVRTEGDFSVLTYFLLEQLMTGKQPLTLKAILEGIQKPMAVYVATMKIKDRPNLTQTPVLIDQMSPSPEFYLRPSEKK